MSGEESKKSGNTGEELAEKLLQEIGWGGVPNGISIKCQYPKLHKQKSHGDDFVYVYDSPFRENLTEVIHISVKHTMNGYPKTEKSFRSDLKNHLIDLAKIVKCAQFNPEVSELIALTGSKPSRRHFGLLVWLHSDKETLEEDRRLELGAMNVPAELGEFPVVLIDSARASFIYHAISHFKSKSLGAPVFYYPRVSATPVANPTREGRVLPIELISSDVIPIKAVLDGKETLYLYLRESFSSRALRKAYHLAKSFVDVWVHPEKIHIGFSDYSESKHQNEKKSALIAFNNEALTVNVFCYKHNLLNLLGGK